MKKIAIIIPSRLNALRLPNKPLKLINKKEMILHVLDIAKSANVGEVIVATPDKKIIDIVSNHGGEAYLTDSLHQTGTDRIYEVFDKKFKKEMDVLINLQGDMPNIDPEDIKKLAEHMCRNLCDIGTLASKLNEKHNELFDKDVCKVVTNEGLEKNKFSSAVDFFRTSDKNTFKHVYHHIGIYGFTSKAIMKYVSLKRTKLELGRRLEQMRALENEMKIDVGFTESCPLSVDNEKDLNEIKIIMEKNE